MRSKPAVIASSVWASAAWLAALGVQSPTFAAPEPTLVLYPRSLNSADDVSALIDLRKHLRADGQFEVLTYDPAGPSMIRAASDAHVSDLLSGQMRSDPDRLAMTQALAATFFVVVSQADGKGKIDARLVEAGPGSRNWPLLDMKASDVAHDIEQDASAALAHPVAAPVTRPLVPASSVNRTLRAAVIPPLIPAAPQPIAAAPAPIAAAPIVPQPVVVAPPVASTTSPQVGPDERQVFTPIAPPAVRTPPAAQPPVQTPTPLIVPAQPIAPAIQAPVAAPVQNPIIPTVSQPASPPVTISAHVPAARDTPSTNLAPPTADDLRTVRKTLSDGDDELARGDFAGAISAYRDSINGAPLSTVPRLKLAEAYQEAGMRDKALDEARRALELAPGSAAVQAFLLKMDADSGTADGSVARFAAQVAADAQNPDAHLEYGDALWNDGSLSSAEAEYKQAKSLADADSGAEQSAAAHLARLYAAQARYDESLSELKDAGAGGYALALQIVQSRMDTLASMLDAAQDAFNAGKSTHADFYKAAGDVSAQAQNLADFVVRVTPPAAFHLSHLYRVQATHLLAQQAADLVVFVETSDASQADEASQLGKEAQTAMLTAHAAEQKLGLWGAKQSEAKN